jgi:hypothetical protein
MPIHFERDDTRKMIRITAEGAATPEEWMAGPRRQAAEGCWHYALLMDIRKAFSVEGCGPVLWDTTSLVQSLSRQHGTRGPVAIVGTDVVAHATARMYTITTHQMFSAIEVFKGVDEAEAWLMNRANARTDARTAG